MRDPAATAEAMRARGVEVEGPSAGSLESPGFSRGWQRLGVAGPAGAGLPFLIRHDSDGEGRRRLLANTAGLAPHPLGARRVAGVTVAVENLERGLDTYRRCFDLEESGARGHDAMLAAQTATLALPSGATIVLASPTIPGHGPVAQVLGERGEGLFCITLAVADLPAAVRDLRGRGLGVRVDEPDGTMIAAQINHRQLHGARLGLVRA
jgi:hypothetical protein